MTDTPAIEERENGPLVVKAVPRLTGADGEAMEAKPVMALCRCGASNSKPFCDGSHNKIGFQSRGGEAAGVDRVLSFSGADVTIAYNPRVCSHAAHCVTQAPAVFDPERKPWCDPDQGDVALIEEVVRACPSGALQMARAGDAPKHLFEGAPGISVAKNGPYLVEDIAPPVPLDAGGMTAGKYVLCRCGKSGAKPYCDGSHRDAGWTDD